MSNLLSQASLVMIPSGYKEDIVYSQIPTNGNGDLTFTRASNGTRVNSAGLVEVAPWNLVQYSEDFSNGVWANYGTGTVTTNTTTAPNGTTTADKFIPNTTNTSHACEQNIGTTSGAIVMSLYAKADGYNWLCFNSYVGGFKFTWFNISTGTIGTVASGVSASIESVGNGWYRCIVSLTGGTSTYFSIIPANANNVTSFAGDGTSGILIWGAQLNIGSTAKPYFPTTDRLNVPRLTYQNGGGGCPSLLLEKQSTNISNQSEDFASWPTQVNVTPTANYATSPDGTQNADRIQFTGAGFMYGANGYSQTSGVVYTLSCWAKRNGSGSQSVGFFVDGSGTINSAWSLSSEYQRFTYTYTAGNSSLVGIAGASGADVSVWGWQFEASSYATSYIPTTSSSATRVVDACYKTGISSLIGQTTGTIFLEMTPVGLVTTYTERLIKIYGGGQEIGLQRYSDSRLVGYGYLGGASNEWTFDIANVFTSTTQSVKIAMAYASNDVAIYVNGIQKGTDTSASMFSSLSAFTFAEDITGDLLCSQNIKQAVIFPTRLTNAELASLTTL